MSLIKISHKIMCAQSTQGVGSSDGTGTSGSRANEPVSESGVKEDLESYSDSDSGAGVTAPLLSLLLRCTCATNKLTGTESSTADSYSSQHLFILVGDK